VRYAVILLIVLAAGCGGGGNGGSTDSLPGTPAPSRPGLYYGYYGSCPTCLAQTIDHINLLVEFPQWYGEQQVIEDINQAKLPTILGTIGYTPVQLANLFTELRNANLLRYVVALYPFDEPNVAGLSDRSVSAVVAQQRQVAAQFVELAGVRIACIYGPGLNLPGRVASFDWVGFDDYANGPNAVGGELDTFEKLLNINQSVMVVPGGADPFRTSPDAFYLRAQVDPRILIIMPFLWTDYSGGQGIGSNGMAPVYRPYGLAISHP